MRIVDPDENGIGEVTVTGPHLMSGYWKSPEATAQVIKDGWLHTGDLGYLAPDGRLHITGRKKDVIVLSSGKNIFPEPLEQHYQSASPLIAEMAICSLSGANGVSEQLHAVIVPEFTELQKRGIVNIREAILYDLQSAGKTLQAHERLHGFDIRKDPLPRTTARKLQRFRILEELRDRETQTETVAVAEPEQTAPDHQVIDIIRRMKGVHRVAPAMDLELDLSFDSLERVELLANVQDRFQVRFSESQTAKILTVADLIETVQAAASSDQAPAEWTSWRDILNEPLTPEEQALADTYLSPRPIAGPLLFVFTRIIALLARIFLRFRFDAKPWPETYPFVMAANHQSLLDTPLLMGRVPYRVFDRIFFLSTSRLHRGWFQTAFGRWARGIPIDPDRRLKSALRLAAEGLRRGLVLCVFPEGHRSLDESMQPFRKGLAILAVEQQVPVIPVGIRGTGKVWGRARKGFHLSPVSIETGDPLIAGSATHDEFNARLFSAVEALVKKPT
jgi:long-chain acyl-CoA synthetase